MIFKRFLTTFLLNKIISFLIVIFWFERCGLVEHVWNVMAHAQKPDLVFQRNGRVHLNRQGHQFSRLLAAEVCASAVIMVVMLDTPCSEAECKTAGYPLHSPVSPSLPLPCVTVCHQVSTELYLKLAMTISFSYVVSYYLLTNNHTKRQFPTPISWSHSSINHDLQIYVYWFLARQPSVGQGLLIHQVSRSHITTYQCR